MGLSALEKAGEKAAPFLKMARNINTIFNTEVAQFDALLAAAGVATIIDVTDAQLKNYFNLSTGATFTPLR